MPRIGVDLLLFVQRLRERKPLRNIVDGRKEKSHHCLRREHAGKEH